MQPLTTAQRMIDIAGSTYVALRVDDNDDGVITGGTDEQQYLDEIIADASQEAYPYLLHHYDEDDLVTSDWVQRRVAWVALHLISQRRGEPGQYAEHHDRAIAEFTASQQEQLWIPDLTPRDNFAPSMSNQTVDHRFGRRKLRTDQFTSTGGQDDRQAYQPVFAPGATWI